MEIRGQFTYANVAATLALASVIGGGGAYAAGLIDSGDIENNSIESRDLRNRKAVRAIDVRRDALTGKQIKERTIDARDFAPIAGDQDVNCDPTNAAFVECAATTVRLTAKGQLFVVATGEFYSQGDDANLTCRIGIDGDNTNAGASPGENADNTDLGVTDGFAATLVTNRLSKGTHAVALRCSEPGGGDGRLDGSSIAVLGISG